MFKRFLFWTAIAISACNTTTTTAVKEDSLVNAGVNDLLLNTGYDVSQLKGLYAGTFDGTPISISINYISGKRVSGYNVHKGLKRNMRGTIEPFGSQMKMVLDEPGDNKYDGHFELFIDTASFSGKGKWTTKNEPTLGSKEFSFTRSEQSNDQLVGSVWHDEANYRDLMLQPDGAASLSYYENKGTPREQMQTVAGNWQRQKDSVVIFWQPNVVFPSRRSAFFIQTQTYDGDSTRYIQGLKGEKAEWVNFGG